MALGLPAGGESLWVKREATGMIWGLEHFSEKERLRESGLVGLEKGGTRGDPIDPHKYPSYPWKWLRYPYKYPKYPWKRLKYPYKYPKHPRKSLKHPYKYPKYPRKYV